MALGRRPSGSFSRLSVGGMGMGTVLAVRLTNWTMTQAHMEGPSEPLGSPGTKEGGRGFRPRKATADGQKMLPISYFGNKLRSDGIRD